MNTRYTTVNLDVSQQGSIPSITLSQYDLGVGLGFYIMDGGLPYSEFAETDTVVLSGTKPSGVGFTIPAYYKSGNLCSFRTTQAMTTEAGTVTCEITITKVNNISVSTANFFVEVEASAHAHETVDEDIENFGLIADQVGEYKATAVRAAQQAAQSATDAAESAGSAEESMEAAQSAASSAIAAKDDIQEYIDDSEAWARGTRGGSAVSSTDETYENNSKYYAEQSSASALAAGVSQSEAAASAQEAAASVVGAVKYTAQSLTTEQKAQARTNIDAASPSDIPSGTVRYDASQNLTDAQKTQALANIGGAFAGSVAREFNVSTAYAVGDTVVYQGRLYEFTSAHAAGAWNASHVTAISVMGEVSDLKGDLSDKQAEINLQNAILKSVGVGYPVESPDSNVYFADEDGKIGIILRDGFDSANAEGIEAFYHPDYPNGAIVDSDGNILEVLSPVQPLKGKTFSILGDSISTYQGYIPSGYAVYYPRGDVDNVNKTWWKKLIALSGMTLVKNASWSGSTVTGNTGSSSAAAGCSDARISDLKDGTTVPDIIICYISTNDWALNRELGSYDSKENVDTSSATINTVADAYALMLYKIRNTYPNAIVYCVTSLEGRQTSGDTSYPILNTQGNTLHEVNHVVEEVAHIFGARVIDLQTCGIHYWNVANYTVDGTLHPNNAGTTVIANIMNRQLCNDFR